MEDNNNKNNIENKKIDDIIEYERLLFDGNNIFIDYFLEIGIKPEIFTDENIFNKNLDELNEIIKPEILCKFPNIDKKKIQINNEIIKNLFPNGYKLISSNEKPNKINFSLILDNRFYSAINTYKFITCAIIYEDINQYKEIYNLQKENKINIENKENKENIYIPKCLCFVSIHPYFNYFTIILNTLINLFEEKIKVKSDFLLDKIIQHIIIETPEIPRGLRKINLNIIKDINILIEEHKMSEIPLLDFEIRKYYKLFSSQEILEILKYILLEKKIIFFSSNIENLTYIIMIFLSMIFPLKYQYLIISILHKEIFHLINNKLPYIFGINESYKDNFLQINNLNIKDSIILIDIDNGLIDAKITENENPQIPISLRNKFEDNSRKLKNDILDIQKLNDIYREMFLSFMTSLLENYSKYLIKDSDVKIGMKLTSLINIDAYLNSLGSENEFYSKFFETQLFYDFIYKRIQPKNINDKMDILLFDEKINNKSKKTIFSKSKPNFLLNSKEYDFKETIEIKNEIALTSSDKNFFSNLNNIEKTILHGYEYNINENNKIEFKYYIFPILINEELFIKNIKNFSKTLNYNQEIEELNYQIINKSSLSLSETKKISEMDDYIYSCWITTFALTFWYTDKEEKKYRFYQLMEILKKKENFNMEIIELIFKAIVNCNQDDLSILLYQEIINWKLEPTWGIFSMISNIIKNKNLNNYYYDKFESKDDFTKKEDYLRKRTMKNSDDENILSEDVIFFAYDTCIECQKIINIFKQCKDLEKFKKDDKWIKCSCQKQNILKLNFRFGIELFNNDITNESSSKKESVLLYNPKALMENLLKIGFNEKKIDVENFKNKHKIEFWNLIWYFKLLNLDITFMLPYSKITESTLTTEIENNKYISFQYKDNLNNNNNEEEKLLDIKLTEDYSNTTLEIFEGKNIIFDKNELSIQKVFNFEILPFIGMINSLNVSEHNNSIPITYNYNNF